MKTEHCKRLIPVLLALVFSVSFISSILAQSTPGAPVSGVPVNRSTVVVPVVIVTGNTFQQILPSVVSSGVRQSLTIQNNNASDACWIYLGSGTATKATSISLAAGQAYTRYFPYVPSDLIQATCATAADTLYVDYQ